jgi:hypothetical protein
MRSLSAALEAAQKTDLLEPTYKVVFSGAASGTFEQDRILLISPHIEKVWDQQATIVLDNSDDSITTDFKAAKMVITYGLQPPWSSNTSSTAPLWVVEQYSHKESKTVIIRGTGLPNQMDEDHASENHVQDTEDLKTIKDLITEVVKGVIDTRLNDAAYSLDDLVIPITPNGFIFKCTTAGTAGASPPTWDLDIGDTTTDNGVTWTNVGKTIAVFSHTRKWVVDFDSEDDLLDSFNLADAFYINGGDTRTAVLQRLLAFTKCAMRFEADGDAHVFVPTVDGPTWAATTAYTLNDYVRPTVANTDFAFKCTRAGTSGGSQPTWPTSDAGTVDDPDGDGVEWTAVAHHYAYKWGTVGEHDVWDNATRKGLLQPNYMVAKSPDGADEDYEGFAKDPDADLTDAERRDYRFMRLASNAEATSIATALLQDLQLGNQAGSFSAPNNIGQEVYDYVRVTDARESPQFGPESPGTTRRRVADVRVWNVGGIERTVGQGRWEIRIALGDLEQGFIGLDPPIEEEPEEGPPEDPDEPTELEAALAKMNKATATLRDRVIGLSGIVARHGTSINNNALVQRSATANTRTRLGRVEARIAGFETETLELHHVTVSAAYTAKDEDQIIGVDTDVGAVTITLKDAAAVAGRTVVIHDEGKNAATNNITITTTDNIEESSSDLVLNSNGVTASLYSDGTDWWRL